MLKMIVVCCLTLVGNLIGAETTNLTITNAATWNLGSTNVCAGQLISIFGTGLTRGETQSAAGDRELPYQLANVRVTFNGAPGHLLYVSGTQINAQVPLVQTSGEISIMVWYKGNMVGQGKVGASNQAPGLFASQGYPVITNQIGYLVGGSTYPVNLSNGDVFITLWGTGFGQTTPDFVPGVPTIGTPLRVLSTPLRRATLDGVHIEILYLGLTPGYNGLYQMNLRIPRNTPNGERELKLNVGGVDLPPIIVHVRQ